MLKGPWTADDFPDDQIDWGTDDRPQDEDRPRDTDDDDYPVEDEDDGA